MLQSRQRLRTAEDNVIIKSRRRCCLCVYLNGDVRRKNGQLAHINKNRSSSAEEQLVWLCTDVHHNEYDSTTRQCKNITEGEIRHYKKMLERAIEVGEIGLQSAQGSHHSSVRFVSIEIADESSWFEMEECDAEDHVLFSAPWIGAVGQGELPLDKQTDPIFDVTLLNGEANSVLLRVGVIAKRSDRVLSGFTSPERVAVFDENELQFTWKPGKPQWTRLKGGPVQLLPNTPYRYTLRLRGYTKAVPGNRGILSLVCQTDRGVVESCGLCLAS